jgi:hypothetical protein
MRGYFASVIAFAAIVPSIALARSDDIPTLDMKPICRGIASQSADPGVGQGGQADTFQRCMESEQEVREQLKKEWSAFSAEDKRHCVELAKTGGESTNTELLTCLEMSRDVRIMRAAAAAERTKSSAAAANRTKSSAATTETTKPASSLLTPASPAASPAPVESAAKLTTKMEEDRTNKDAERARTDALAAKASEAVTQRKLADTEEALKRAKEELDRAKAEAERAKADAQGARTAEAAANRKLADAEAGRAAAEKACQGGGDTAPSGLGSRLRRWLGRPAPNP